VSNTFDADLRRDGLLEPHRAGPQSHSARSGLRDLRRNPRSP
jgi:hypothetical protein